MRQKKSFWIVSELVWEDWIDRLEKDYENRYKVLFEDARHEIEYQNRPYKQFVTDNRPFGVPVYVLPKAVCDHPTLVLTYEDIFDNIEPESIVRVDNLKLKERE